MPERYNSLSWVLNLPTFNDTTAADLVRTSVVTHRIDDPAVSSIMKMLYRLDWEHDLGDVLLDYGLLCFPWNSANIHSTLKRLEEAGVPPPPTLPEEDFLFLKQFWESAVRTYGNDALLSSVAEPVSHSSYRWAMTQRVPLYAVVSTDNGVVAYDHQLTDSLTDKLQTFKESGDIHDGPTLAQCSVFLREVVNYTAVVCRLPDILGEDVYVSGSIRVAPTNRVIEGDLRNCLTALAQFVDSWGERWDDIRCQYRVPDSDGVHRIRIPFLHEKLVAAAPGFKGVPVPAEELE